VSWSLQTAGVLGLIGVGVGAFGTVVGAGGGFILTPILLLLYPHDSPQTLTAISLAAVFFNAASGSFAYARQRRIDFRSGTVFAIATLPGAIGGALVVGVVSRRLFDGIMAAVLTLLASWLLVGERWPLPPPKGYLERRDLVDRAGQHYVYSVPLRRGAIYSLGVGFVSSFLGIGGGVIHVPLLVRALGFPTHLATATSHFVLAIYGRHRHAHPPRSRKLRARTRPPSHPRALSRRRRRRPTRRTPLAPTTRPGHSMTARDRAARALRTPTTCRVSAPTLKNGRLPTKPERLLRGTLR